MRILLSLCLLLSALLAAPALAQDRPALERDFRAWLEARVWPDAQKRGVTPATFDAATGSIALQWSLPELRPPGAPPPAAQKQAEFSAPGRYFDEKNFAALIPRARDLRKQHAREIAAIERRYGVPGEILLAIWGRESAFGRAKIPHDAVQALATLGFMGARKETFYPELIAALVILEQEHAAPGTLRSSWAGALGQPQFMPSKFLQFAVDFDGDGRRDIWNSVPDTLGSIANFLVAHGWKSGRHWGVEIPAPPGNLCTLEGPDKGRPLAEWAKLGALPASHAKAARALGDRAFLLMPAGRHGPAFLVSENFYVLKSYNESDLYASFVGHLGERIADGRPLRAEWKPITGLSRNAIRDMQRRLEAHGHDVGGTDGLVGFRTRVAVGVWQAKNGMEPTCFPEPDIVARIQ